MSGMEYLSAIKAELEAGRHQHRMGENILGAFGYIRRRQTAIDEINDALTELGLKATPPITQEMPLRTPRIRFSLDDLGNGTSHGIEVEEPEAEDSSGDGDTPSEVLISSFRIAELDAVGSPVECIPPDSTIAQACTRMALNKYSQLVVANGSTPRQQDIKGIVSYQSIAKALLAGTPETVRECIDNTVPVLRSDSDLKDVLPLLGVHDVVLVVGVDHRLQGIVTAWDLAEEFAKLVDPFKRIGEVEERLRALLSKRVGTATMSQFLSDNPAGEGGQGDDVDAFTIGDLQRVVENPEHWSSLGLASLDRVDFASALGRTRVFRNRLMHFRDPLNENEMNELTNFCDLVRDIPL